MPNSAGQDIAIRKLPGSENFVKPVYSQEFDCTGFTSMQVAHSLGVSHWILQKKLDRNFDFLLRYGLQPYGCDLVDSQGKTVKGCFISVELAKYLAVTWKSEKGVGYFRKLLEYEQFALGRREIGKGKPTRSSAKFGHRPVYQTTIFGTCELVAWEKVPIEQISKVERAQGLIHKLSAQILGMQNTLRRCYAVIDAELGRRIANGSSIFDTQDKRAPASQQGKHLPRILR